MKPEFFAINVTGLLVVLGVSTAAAQRSDDGLSVRVQSEHPAVIVLPNRLDQVQVSVRNETGKAIKGTLRLGIRNRTVHPVNLTLEHSLSVAHDAAQSVSLPREIVGNLGIKYLDWEVHAGGQYGSGVTSFAHMDPVGVTPEIQSVPPKEKDEFILGMAGGIRPYHDKAFKKRFLHAAAIVGAEAYRADMSWNALQPDPDTWRWEGLDEMVALARRYGMFIQPLVAYGNPWAVSDETRALAKQRDDLDHIWRYPPRLGPWAEFNRKLAGRYGTRMQYYEIWNEPDISFFKGNAEQYLSLLQTAYREIKGVDPNIQVTTGGFTSMSHGELDRDLQRLALTEGRTGFDAIAWHRHGDFDGFQDEVDNQLLPWLRELGHEKTPLVFNESAVPRSFDKEWELASQLVKKITFTWSRGAIGHYWYNLMRSAPEYQMLNEDWTPRPSYPAYNQLARLLSGRRFSHELDLGAGLWAFAFHGKGHFSGQGNDDWVVVAWQEDHSLSAESVSVHVGAEARIRQVDLMGNARSVSKDEQKSVQLEIKSEPAYWIIEQNTVRPRISN